MQKICWTIICIQYIIESANIKEVDFMNHLERFIHVMEYKPVDRVPNWEAGVWAQTKARWAEEGMDIHSENWDWFTGSFQFRNDPREFIKLHSGMIPPFPTEVLERNDRYEIMRNSKGIVTKALLEGSIGQNRMCMDEYLSFPVETQEDFDALKKRYIAKNPARLPAYWEQFLLPGWERRTHPLILGENCSTPGFYWMMREWMGTEGVCYAFYDEPDMVHDMCAFWADYLIELFTPIMDKIAPDYICINEDMAMKSGPLLSPATYKEFIFPHMRRLVDFLKGKGLKYVIVDTDGNSEPLLPALLEAGVDGIWPIERASDDQDPMFLRRKYGRALRMLGGVDKRELAKGKEAISHHLRSLIPLIEDGGFIPTVDHTVPPDVSLDNFRYYMEKKEHLLRFEFDKI